MKCESIENPPLVNSENKQLKSLKPSGALGSADYSQKTSLTSLDFEFLKVQAIEREASHNAKPINNWAYTDQYIDCIQKNISNCNRRDIKPKTSSRRQKLLWRFSHKSTIQGLNCYVKVPF
jgi:hypothetical protein